jgi:hypothetical protein
MKITRCENCSEEILKDLKWNNWLKMVNFIDFLELDGSITSELAQEMSDCMMCFKKEAMDEDEKRQLDYLKGEFDLIERSKDNPENPCEGQSGKGKSESVNEAKSLTMEINLYEKFHTLCSNLGSLYAKIGHLKYPDRNWNVPCMGIKDADDLMGSYINYIQTWLPDIFVILEGTKEDNLNDLKNAAYGIHCKAVEIYRELKTENEDAALFNWEENLKYNLKETSGLIYKIINIIENNQKQSKTKGTII